MYEFELRIGKKHRKAAKLLADKITEDIKPKYIIAISGENRTGKSAVAHSLGVKLEKKGIVAKIIHMASYYNLPPAEREKKRKLLGIESIGFDEINWKLIQQNINDFKNDKPSTLPLRDAINNHMDKLITDFKGIDVLIIDGLYAIKIEECDLKVFIENTFKETISDEPLPEGESPDAWKRQVYKREHALVKSIKNQANYFIDFNVSNEEFRY
ncbi:MAG: uridine kinase [Bacteroidetes bacterium HGW-Bacteroidetes-22]|nr:MAG: uridine kinase [Bacteroidetes bacterium HGW-Bacteroidetes-22]